MNIPRKRFGQHFLHDPAIIERMIGCIDPKPGDLLLEIGPGRGALTAPLLARGHRLHAIEIDRDLAAELPGRVTHAERLSVQVGDALGFDYAALAQQENQRLRVVGNLPYNISTPLLFHLLEHRSAIVDLHACLQAEVVARMTAQPGSKQYGRLTVMLGALAEVVSLFSIGAGAFRPAPRVRSGFVRLSPLQRPLAVDRMEDFTKLVRQAFSKRRKVLRNALKDSLSEAEIERAGVDPGLRPERISAEQYAALSNAWTRRSQNSRTST